MRSGVAAITLVLIAGLVGCRDNNGVQGPSVDDFQAERARLAAKAKQQAARRRGGAQVAHAKPNAGDKADYAEVAPTYTYDPKGKRDPFRSFRFVNLRLDNAQQRGPLEQFELGQLAVIAVVWDAHRPHALVSDPGGQTYIVREGSRVGKNEGRVIHIGDNLVLVKETYVDFAGEQTTKDVELRIHTADS